MPDPLDDEQGRISASAPAGIALLYPASYHVGMSSLGLLTIYRIVQSSGDLACERFFAPDKPMAWDAQPVPRSVESSRPLSDFPVIAVSVAWELELADLLRMLHAAGIPPLRQDRGPQHPLVIAGGPLTFSNPVPLGPFVDAIVMGEADAIAADILRTALDAPDHDTARDRLAAMAHVVVPSVHGEQLTPLARCPDELLPAWAPIRTPNTELRDMFLVEAVRGCSRGCRYCVMRRGIHGGMRMIPVDRILASIPDDARRVGLVGASVSDHPGVPGLVETLADRGLGVGLSSLRADRLDERFVAALRKAGYKTLTTALDGSSDRIREQLERRTTADQIRRVTQLAREAGIERLKLYMMVGVPGETEEDLQECADLARELSRILPTSLGISPFCPKRNTPLSEASFDGVKSIDRRLDFLRSAIAGRAEVRATSARWAWVESVLAKGGHAEGMAVLEAVREGGSFASWRKAFGSIGHRPDGN